MRITSSGNVGIGTSSPQSIVHAVQSNSTAPTSGTTPSGYALSYGAGDGNNGGIWFSSDFGGDQGIAGIAGTRVSGYQTDLRFYTNNTNSARAFAERMRITSGGNVGIGTSSPQNKLDVVDSSFNQYSLRVESATGNTANRYGGIGFAGETNNTKAAILFVSDGTSFSRGSIVFSNNNASDQTNANLTTERMRITSGGDIGIGTTNATGQASNNRVVQIYGAGTANRAQLHLVNSDTGEGTSDGSFIGVDSSTNLYIINAESAATIFENAGSERMRITSGGNVLINTTTDAGYKLDVNGGTRIRGNLRLDGSSVDSPLLSMVGLINTIITMGDRTSATTDVGSIQIRNGGTPVIDLNADTGSNSYFNTGGGLLINTIVDAGAGYKLQVDGSMLMTYASFFNFRGSSPAGDVLVDNSGSTLRITGNVTVSGSVTATGGFFDTSDSRLKIVINDYDNAKGIEKVEARLYLKNNKKELGYFAQDVQEILPSAVSEGSDGFLTLSYSQVHTAKIAYLEKEIAELKELIKSLS
jgi:hypothetical protein